MGGHPVRHLIRHHDDDRPGWQPERHRNPPAKPVWYQLLDRRGYGHRLRGFAVRLRGQAGVQGFHLHDVPGYRRAGPHHHPVRILRQAGSGCGHCQSGQYTRHRALPAQGFMERGDLRSFPGHGYRQHLFRIQPAAQPLHFQESRHYRHLRQRPHAGSAEPVPAQRHYADRL